MDSSSTPAWCWLALSYRLKLPQDSPLLAQMSQSWNAGLRKAFEQLPRFDWEAPPTADVPELQTGALAANP
ncbi:hypothetical protein U5801_24230 [Lamprobacter modestohalophilus]|uniref:hypothetical protein n=1 Tax=Lamprobacter modestohalophilus TaxID=1064514 RepID=UPI002ADEC3EA|nr:hypothetical protein [Lamprobacter modestohalophilus]MEA1052890.1 hypothetical protein [Lamprobacter modestohalophilus]